MYLGRCSSVVCCHTPFFPPFRHLCYVCQRQKHVLECLITSQMSLLVGVGHEPCSQTVLHPAQTFSTCSLASRRRRRRRGRWWGDRKPKRRRIPEGIALMSLFLIVPIAGTGQKQGHFLRRRPTTRYIQGVPAFLSRMLQSCDIRTNRHNSVLSLFVQSISYMWRVEHGPQTASFREWLRVIYRTINKFGYDNKIICRFGNVSDGCGLHLLVWTRNDRKMCRIMLTCLEFWTQIEILV